MGIIILFGLCIGGMCGLFALIMVLDFFATTGRKLPWEDRK